MHIETKFNFGDGVWLIRSFSRKETRKCSFCDGSGQICGQNKNWINCPECYGKGIEYSWTPNIWQVDNYLTIGEIQIKTRWEQPGLEPDSMFDNYKAQEEKYEEKYMCLETGIGSGYVHDVSRLFLTKEEAQTECNALNMQEETEVEICKSKKK
jgi:hypothetical protein